MLDRKLIRFVNSIYAVVLIFFFGVIFLPAVYVLKYSASQNVFSHPMLLPVVYASFMVGLAVTFLNLVFGVPLAWVLTRYRNRFVKVVDNLVDLSLVMPTAALGFSIYLYWGTAEGFWGFLGLRDGLIGRGYIMIILLHLVFTLPYMIRSVGAAIEQLENQAEEAAATLGASSFTFFRTVALPLFRNGIVSGSVLTFTRSLSETGATIMVAGSAATAPVYIISLKDAGNLPAAAGVSIVLMLTAVSLLLIAKVLAGERRIRLYAVNPDIERSVSRLAPLKNLAIMAFFILIIFLPTIQIILYSFGGISVVSEPVLLWKSMALSLLLALLATAFNFLFAVPFAYMIARDKFGIGPLADTLSDMVLLVPTGALGLSLSLFWQRFIPSEPLILLLAHMSFTFPLMVKPITTAIQEISPSQQEAAYTLGAGIRTTLSTILIPQIKPAIIAGSIMAFMRSISETGATLAVTRNLKTVTVLIVEMFNSGNMPEAAYACTVLFAIALAVLVIMKRLNRGPALSG